MSSHKRSPGQDPAMQVLNLLLDRRNLASAAGNTGYVNALDGLIEGALTGGADGALRAYIDGPDYNRPRAKQARDWIAKVVEAHNTAARELTALFRENASGNSRHIRKLRKEFSQICKRMEPYNERVTHTYESGSTVSGPRLMVEGELSMDPFLKRDAEVICAFWSQAPTGIESGARALAGVGQNAGPRLVVVPDPNLN